MAVKSVPEGYHTATPYIIVDDPVTAIEFYKRAFGAEEIVRLTSPDGAIAHAEIKIGDSVIMIGGEYPNMGYVSPKKLNGHAMSLMLYVDDVDGRFQQALTAGATEAKPVKDQFYGDRSGAVKDPYGHIWTIATHKEELSQEEIERRFAELMKQQGG